MSMTTMGRIQLVLIPLLATLCAMASMPKPAQAYYNSYIPIADSDLAKTFKLTPIPIVFDEGESAHFGKSEIRIEGLEMVVSGKDLQGKRWNISVRWSGMGGYLYTADLDHNGIPDLIYARYTGGNGLAPPVHVITVLFDAEGRPVPSEMDGYFQADQTSVRDFVDLDHDGRAELIRQSYDDGYWVTSLYEARNGYWYLIRGQHGSYSFPLYSRFTNRPNRVATTPGNGRHPLEDDLSNNGLMNSGISMALKQLKWAKVEVSQDPELVLSDGTVCVPDAWNSTMSVIIDDAKARVGTTLDDADRAHELLNSIVQRGWPVRLSGHRRYHRGHQMSECVPESIWAIAPHN